MSNLAQSMESNDAASARLDLPPPAVIDLLSSLHRLLKVARMYDKNNQALAGGAEAVIAATAEYCAVRSTDSADLMFANDTVFANGQMLQMPREVYERVMELGGLLEKCDVANVCISRTATASDLVAFVHTLGNVLRDPSLRAELAAPKYGGVRARPLRWRAGLEGDADQSVVARVLRTYASAVVVLRRFYAEFADGSSKVPLAVRRLAQRIVSHAEHEPPLLVALAAARNLGTDEAALSVTAALVAVLMGRQLTSDRNALTDLVLAALLHDVGRRRLVAKRGGDRRFSSTQAPLSDDEKSRLAASDALAVLGVEGISELTIPRTVISFEAHWQTVAAERAQRGGQASALYDGRRPTSVLGRVLSVARSFSELMAPGPHSAMTGPDDAIQFLLSRATDDTQRLFLRLLTGGLGIFPPGTSVELSTGEIAVVTCVPESAADFGRPSVRIMYDVAGNAVTEPFDVDLSVEDHAHGGGRSIRRALDTDAQQTQAMRAFVLSVSRGRADARELARRDRTAPPGDGDSGKRPSLAQAAGRAGPPPVRAGAFDEMTLQRSGQDGQPTVPVPPPSVPRREAAREARPRVVDSRAEEGSAPSSRSVEVIAPRERTRPPIDVAALRERTKPPFDPAEPRDRTKPPFDIVAPGADVGARVRTRPPVEEAVAARVRSRPPIEEAVLPRDRTRPPVDAGDAVKSRERTRPPIDVVGPLPRPATNPMAFRPAGGLSRPRTDPGSARQERPMAYDPRSEPDDAGPVSQAPRAELPRLEPRRQSMEIKARPVAPPTPPAVVPPPQPVAPTPVRGWADFEATLDPAPKSVSKPRSDDAPTAPPPPMATPVHVEAPTNHAPTIARNWGELEAESVLPELDDFDEEPGANPTRKADWGYDKLVDEAKPAARVTRRVDKVNPDDPKK